MKPIISILRPQQWVKNCFVLLPLFFNGGILDVPLLLSAMTMTIAFCFAASGIYCLNDICDVEADRLHPKKCLRPVACGAVSRRLAFALIAFCMITSISLVCLLQWLVEVDIIHLLGIILLSFVGNHSALSSDEYSLLRPTKTDSDSRCLHHCSRICAQNHCRGDGYGCFLVVLDGLDDFPVGFVPGFFQTQG